MKDEKDLTKLLTAVRNTDQVVVKSEDEKVEEKKGSKEGDDDIISVHPDKFDQKSKSLLRQSYGIETLSEYSKPIEVVSLMELEEAINAVNETQTNFGKYLRYQEGGAYKLGVDASDFLLNLLGKKKLKPTIHDFYNTQLSNVSRVNDITNSLIEQSTPIIDQLRQSIKNLLRDLTVNREKEKTLDENFPKFLDNYAKLIEETRKMSSDDENYYGKLGEQLEQQWKNAAVRFIYQETKKDKVDRHTELGHFMLLDKLLTTFFYDILGSNKTSKNYQETLQKFAVIYPTVEILAQASRGSQEGVNILSDYQKRLNHNFVKTVDDIVKSTAENPYITKLVPESSNLKTLLANAQEISKTKALQYEKQATDQKVLK